MGLGVVVVVVFFFLSHLELVTVRKCGVSFCGDVKNMTECGPE